MATSRVAGAEQGDYSRDSEPGPSFAEETMRSRPFRLEKRGAGQRQGARASMVARRVLRTIGRSRVFPAGVAVSGANERAGSAAFMKDAPNPGMDHGAALSRLSRIPCARWKAVLAAGRPQ